MFWKWKVVGVLKNGWCCLNIYAKFLHFFLFLIYIWLFSVQICLKQPGGLWKKWSTTFDSLIWDWSFVSTQRPGILFSYISSVSVGQKKENSFLWLYPFWSRFYLWLNSELSFYQQDPESKYFHVKGKQESNEKWSSYSVQLSFDVPPLPYTKDGKIPCLCSGTLVLRYPLFSMHHEFPNLFESKSSSLLFFECE